MLLHWCLHVVEFDEIREPEHGVNVPLSPSVETLKVTSTILPAEIEEPSRSPLSDTVAITSVNEFGEKFPANGEGDGSIPVRLIVGTSFMLSIVSFTSDILSLPATSRAIIL